MPSNFFKKKRIPTTAGFGLVELLVTMTIMSLVSAVVLVNESSFKGAVVMRNQAYEVAFMLRQAQLLAVGGSSDATTVDRRFGVRIDSTNNTIMIFNDLGASGYSSSEDSIIEQRRLDRRFLFEEISVVSGGSTLSPDIIDVVFTRPNFDAVVLNDSGNPLLGTLFIDIGMNNTDSTRRIEVLSGGSISVLSN